MNNHINMKKLTFIYLIIIISIVIISCDRDEIVISDTYIDDVQIHAADISKEFAKIKMQNRYNDDNETPKYFAVTALVRTGFGGCRSYYKTRLFTNSYEINVNDSIVVWNPGETIEIDIDEREVVGNDDCTDDFYYFYQAIFVGFCTPGEYTIVVNNYELAFTINETGTIS